MFFDRLHAKIDMLLALILKLRFCAFFLLHPRLHCLTHADLTVCDVWRSSIDTDGLNYVYSQAIPALRGKRLRGLVLVICTIILLNPRFS